MSEDKKSDKETDYFYDMPAVWALDPDAAVPRAVSRPPESFLEWCLSLKHSGQPVILTLHSGHSWTLVLRAVAATWLSAETTTTPARGIVISNRAVASLEGGVDSRPDDHTPLGVSMLDALGHSLRVNPRVEVGTSATQWVGSVAHRGVDFLELHTRPDLSAQRRVVAIPEASIEFVRFLEPGDSF